MDFYSSEDPEELHCKYGVVGFDFQQLVGIVNLLDLAEANCVESSLEILRYGGDVDEGLAGACLGGHKELALLMIQNGAIEFGWAYDMACRGGHKELALLMIQNGVLDLNAGMAEACFGGHRELVLFLSRKIKSSGASCDWNLGLSRACESGQKELALLMIRKGAKNLNWGLARACEGGQKDMALLMIQMGANDWDWALSGACSAGNEELALLMIDKGANWESAVDDAYAYGHPELVAIMRQRVESRGKH
jgi:hypothetical protein